MVKQTVIIDGAECEFESKKEMLIQLGGTILAGSDQSMTLRQLYYRFVAKDLLENKQSQYQYLSEAMTEARIDGRVPWDAIEDRTRGIDAGDYDAWDPVDRFERNLRWFDNTPDRHYRPRWEEQECYVEVWVEKEALAGVFAAVCEELKVVTFPSKGYTSITLLHDAAERLRRYDGKRRHILYFGDYDPSGQDIERNIREKLQETFGVPVTVDRKALTREQIDTFELPPQPAKTSDARYEKFVQEHGDIAVELDALPPDELRSLIRESAEEYFDQDVFDSEVKPRQVSERETIREKLDEVLVDGEVS